MADEVYASFMLPGDPTANLAAWRADPPMFLAGESARSPEWRPTHAAAAAVAFVHAARAASSPDRVS